jgi:hypothetical protein
MKNKLKFLIAAVVAASTSSKLTATDNLSQDWNNSGDNSISKSYLRKPMPILKLNNLNGDFTAINSHVSHSSHRSHSSHYSHVSHRSGGMFI